MREFVKPRVVVSRCIGFEAARWDGKIIVDKFIRSLNSYVEFIPVCPEIEIGLGVPREPIRIVKRGNELRLIQPATGLDFTEKMQQFAKSFLKGLPEVDGFILKSRSPSCAVKDAKIRADTDEASLLCRGSGVFSAIVLAKFWHLAAEDEKRLLNPRIREHFLIKLYTLADFRVVKNSGSINRLIDFQARNKLLFTAYNQKELHAMGRIVAQLKSERFPEVIADYQRHLWSALKRPPRRGAYGNVLTKAAGYFTDRLSKSEKAFFLDRVARYKAGKLHLSVPLAVLKSWIVRFNEQYLMQQTFLEPYPAALAEQECIPPNTEENTTRNSKLL